MKKYYDYKKRCVKNGDIISFTYLNTSHIGQLIKRDKIIYIYFYHLNYDNRVVEQAVPLKAVMEHLIIFICRGSV